MIERWLKIIAPESVLEAGCGQGAMGYRLAARYDYRGYEPDRVSFQTASERLSLLGRGEVVNTPVPPNADRSFDLIVAFEVLEHMNDDLLALRGWARWAKPQGYVMISVPAHPDRFGPMDEKVGHFRRYTRQSLEKVLAESGFVVRAIESWGVPAGYLLEATRNAMARRALRNSDIGTPGSGRLYQPPSGLGRAVEIAMKPLAAMQLPFRHTDLGIGYIAVGQHSR